MAKKTSRRNGRPAPRPSASGVAKQPQTALPVLFEPYAEDEEGRALLGALTSAATGLQAAQAARDEAVQRARAAGVSWGVIGLTLGMTGEGARRRWGKGRRS